MSNYEGTFTTTNPDKIGIILNEVLHNPGSALIIEPIKNEYWIFYYGGAIFPSKEDKEINHFQKEFSDSGNIEISNDIKDHWLFDIIKFYDPFQFFNDMMSVLNKIKNKGSIKVAIDQTEKERKIYIYYKK